MDTATRSCSVALTDGDRVSAEMTTTRKQTHSKHLMGMIDSVLRTAGLTVADLDGFAANRGPGSFTGLRIGISTVKGLALASGKSSIGISGLEALARQFPFSTHLICPILDARKGEVYTAVYQTATDGVTQLTGERAVPPAEAVSGIDRPCIFLGDGALMFRDLISTRLGEQALFAPAGFHTLRASIVAFMAKSRLEKGDTEAPAAFTPRYIRKSDAELHLGSSAHNF